MTTMTHSALMALLILSPLVGFLINGFRYKKHDYKVAGGIASLAIFISLVCSVLLVIDLTDLAPEARQISVKFFEWIASDQLKVDAGFVVDPLSAVMILVITGVGFLIHIFSVGY